MNSKSFLLKYLNDFSDLIKPRLDDVDSLLEVAELCKKVRENQNKILIFGNGGSAAMASHFSVDITKNARIRCLNFNEADLITCFANDYGFDRWVEKAVEFYGNDGDLLILISSSGNSKNMLNAVDVARKKNFMSVITLSGFNKNNPLKKMGNLNLWVNNKSYNFVENTHQIWLLSIVDLIIGSREYSV